MSVDPFRIRDHVADFDAIVRDIVSRSERTRASLAMEDIAYGSDPTETADLFFPAMRRPGMPVHLFIHGGYWRMFSKRDYSYIADTITAAGAIAVIVDYALMPAVRMDRIVDQMRRARRWVSDHIAGHGGDAGRLTVSGHSAGAHLATFLFDETETHAGVRAALLLGGLYDLKPLQSSFLKSEIAITDEEVARFSPLTRRHDPGMRVSILVGADETAPFHSQAEAFDAHLARQGLATTRHALAARNHMSSVRDLGVAGSDAARHLTAMIEATA